MDAWVRAETDDQLGWGFRSGRRRVGSRCSTRDPGQDPCRRSSTNPKAGFESSSGDGFDVGIPDNNSISGSIEPSFSVESGRMEFQVVQSRLSVRSTSESRLPSRSSERSQRFRRICWALFFIGQARRDAWPTEPRRSAARPKQSGFERPHVWASALAPFLITCLIKQVWSQRISLINIINNKHCDPF